MSYWDNFLFFRPFVAPDRSGRTNDPSSDLKTYKQAARLLPIEPGFLFTRTRGKRKGTVNFPCGDRNFTNFDLTSHGCSVSQLRLKYLGVFLSFRAYIGSYLYRLRFSFLFNYKLYEPSKFRSSHY